MAWTLLRASQPAPDTRHDPQPESFDRPAAQPAARATMDGPLEADRDAAGTQAPIRPRCRPGRGDQAWILMGGPTRALYQSGIVERMLDRFGAPRIAYGCGAAAVNTVLAAGGKGADLREGWEALRAMHFLTDIALAALPVVGPSFAATSRRHRLLAALPEARPAMNPDGATTVILLADDGLLRTLAVGTPADVDARLAAALEQRPLDPAYVARAIRDAVARKVDRVLLVGVGDGDDMGTISSEVVRARSQGVDVVSLPYLPSSPPGWIDFLLPATGAVDRTIRDGRQAADRWLADQSEDGWAGVSADSEDSSSSDGAA